MILLCGSIDKKVQTSPSPLDRSDRLALACFLPMNPQISSTSIAAQFQAAHLLIKHVGTSLTDSDTKSHNRITMNAGHALNGSNARAFGQRPDDRDLLFFWEN